MEELKLLNSLSSVWQTENPVIKEAPAKARVRDVK